MISKNSFRCQTKEDFLKEPGALLLHVDCRKSKIDGSHADLRSWKKNFSPSSSCLRCWGGNGMGPDREPQHSLGGGTFVLIRRYVQKLKSLGTSATFFAWLAGGVKAWPNVAYRGPEESKALLVYYFREIYSKFNVIGCPNLRTIPVIIIIILKSWSNLIFRWDIKQKNIGIDLV